MSKNKKNKGQNIQKNTIDNYVNKYITTAYLRLCDDNEDSRVSDQKPIVLTSNSIETHLPKIQPETPVCSSIDLISPKNCVEINACKQCIDLVVSREKCAKLEMENKKLVRDNKALKKLLNESKNINLYKDIQLKKLSKNVQFDAKNLLLFDKFQDHFTEELLIKLRSIPKGKAKDSEFLTILIDYLYGENVANMCLKRSSCNKTEISKQNLQLLGDMLSERVTAEDIPQHNVLLRCSRLNRLIGNAIYNNIRKRRSSTTTAMKENSSTNLSNVQQEVTFGKIEEVISTPNIQQQYRPMSSIQYQQNPFIQLNPVQNFQTPQYFDPNFVLPNYQNYYPYYSPQ